MGKNKKYNKDAKWLPKLDKEYCKNVKPKSYKITVKTFKEVLLNMKNNGAPGNDKINAFCIKKLSSIHPHLISQFNDIFENNKSLPQWFVRGKTILLPKNNDTKLPKNYRPIACLNIIYKIFTGILNQFLVDHCTTNNIITTEQAGGKKQSWGYTDQSLLNKMILEEVQHQRRNLLRM